MSRRKMEWIIVRTLGQINGKRSRGRLTMRFLDNTLNLPSLSLSEVIMEKVSQLASSGGRR